MLCSAQEELTNFARRRGGWGDGGGREVWAGGHRQQSQADMSQLMEGLYSPKGCVNERM